MFSQKSKSLCFLIIVLLSVLDLKVNAAQLVDRIPTELVNNWLVCINYEKRSTECNKQETPIIEQLLTDNATSFIYQKQFIVSSDLQPESLGIWIDAIDDVDEIRINNQLIGKTGDFPPLFQSGFRHKRLYLIPSVFVRYNQFNQLEIKTFSSINHPGLGSQPVIIGDYFKISHLQQEIDYFYIFSMSTLLLLTLFQLFYYLMMKGGSETIFLSMSFVSFSAISFLRSNSPLHIGLNLSSVFKVETFMLSFGLIALSLFTLRFFELKIRGRYLVASVCIAIPGIVSILYPNPLHARYISEIAYLIIGVFSIAMLLGAIIVAFQKKRKYVYVIGGLFFALSLAFCFDIFSQTKSFFDIKLPLNPIVLPFTFTLAAIGLALTITHKYWQSFKNATYDHLTGALLRPAFFQRLTEEMRRSQLKDTSLLLAVIHFEELKVIGESYGQITRNKMLAIISEKLSNLLSPADALCHFNDDEFSISTHIDSSVQAEALLKNIHSSLIGTHQIINKDTKLYFNAQISGVIYDSERHLSISQLVQDANYGLAKVKNLHNRDYLLQEYAVN